MSKGKHLTEGQIQNIKELKENNMDVKDIAYRIGCSLPTVYKYLKPETKAQESGLSTKEEQVLDQIRASKYYDKPTTPTSSKEYVTSDLFLTCALLI